LIEEMGLGAIPHIKKNPESFDLLAKFYL
jgi:hypothetical protein